MMVFDTDRPLLGFIQTHNGMGQIYVIEYILALSSYIPS